MTARGAGARSTTQGWKKLAPGDIVDLVSPGYRSPPDHFEGAVRFLEKWGLVPRVPSRIFAKDLLSSNSDENRSRHLREALAARDSSAIWCIRGGYGSIRLIPDLARMKKPAVQPKLFIGLSDITSLHVFLNQQWGWPTVHGPLLDRLGRGAALPRYEREMKRFVFGEMEEIEFAGLRPLNAEAKAGGVVRGKVSGGNLVVLQSTMGTRGAWDTSGRILFFEDIGERGYRIDRILEQFKQAGMIARSRGIVFGQFNEGLEPDGSSKIWPVIRRFAEGAGVPVFMGLPSGHDKIQRPVPFETRATLELGARGRLICATGVSR